MARNFDMASANFAEDFAAFFDEQRENAAQVDAQVAEIIAQVRREGDPALVELTRRFDRFDITLDALRITDKDMAAAAAKVDKETMAALELAAERVRAFHEKQRPQDLDYIDEAGVRLGQRWSAVDAAGLYVPGGTAAYPSSVLMNALPAQVAGVQRLVMTVPTPGGELNPLVMAAARLAGVSEAYRVGGAQAVAALAYGTQSIARVDKIVGPGNAYVAEAKRQVFGQVGIDMIAGPSEVLIVADASAEPAFLAADLLAQAEHDTAAQSILMSHDRKLLVQVEKEVEAQLALLPREAIARASWDRHGALIALNALSDAPALINALAPEHLELALDEPEALLPMILNAGAIFMGHWTPEALGDYLAGPNHVLPTSRAARFSSGLSVYDFMKRSSILAASPQSLKALGPAAIALARAEGLDAHARSVMLRLERLNRE